MTDLERSFLDFANSLLGEMRERPAPFESRRAVDFQPNGRTVTGTRIAPSLEGLGRIVLEDKQFWKLPAAREFLRVHREAGIFATSTDDSVPAYIGLPWNLAHAVARAAKACDSTYVTQAELLRVYRRLRDAQTGERIFSRITVPLLNTRGDASHRFADMVLAPFPPEEKNAIWNVLIRQDDLSLRAVSRSNHRLRLEKVCSVEETADLDAAVPIRVDRIATALRLTKAGDLGAQVIFYDREESGLGSRYTALSDLAVEPLRKPYDLDLDTASAAADYYEALSQVSSLAQGESLSIALRRFNQAYMRHDAEDKIIDLAIALESSLLKDTQLTYRLALRGACLLRQSEDPREVFALLTEMNKARNKAVHEGSSAAAYTLAPRCEDTVRKILRTYLLRLRGGESITEVNAELDKRILSGLEDQDTR